MSSDWQTDAELGMFFSLSCFQELTPAAITMQSKDQPFFKDLGQRIAKARQNCDLTQEQLAARLGIAQQTLAHYEVGRLRVSASMLPTLADILDLTLDELLGRKAVARRRAGGRAKKSLH